MGTKAREEVSRSFLISKDYVSCTNCAKCYNARKLFDEGVREPSFCQEYSFHILPNTPESQNQERGLNCEQFVPEFANRAIMRPDAPEHIRWYEKENMA